MTGDVRIGISGWRYAPWRGVFYPPGLAQRRELEFASRQMRSVEINGSFYSLQRPDSYRAWRAETPDDFVFSVKGPRFVTHMKKLAGVETPLANFFASGVLALGDRMGPLLWQLPPNLGFDADRLARFFDLLPRSTAAAARLAEQHDDKVPEGRALTETDADRPLRHVLEVRHGTFVTPAFPALLRAHDVGLVVADTAGRWPHLEDLTSDVVYVRLHGESELYVSGYDDDSLDRWAAKVRAWSTGAPPPDGPRVAPPAADRPRDVYVYFDNDVKVRAPFDAMALAARLGAGPRAAPA
ncbi:DUF72 domain-containing protein [Cellulomonas sp. JZ18]|uniref:DUF72 domain-containing protein n=1 Tax=Cellulomonas sp. JZ18 TaxID=2654191 RepID=UPI0012D4AA28|nr:DUF72 domain-containing protein [Cellulomonas sp. JZ18]QGQ17997.1 DUF72 domain-containing protein [Cellulomonas sp. JZ18]